MNEREELLAKARELYFGIAECIASVPQEYRATLCRDFRINPKDVGAALSRPQSASQGSEMPSQERK